MNNPLPGIKIHGISTCLPENKEYNEEISWINPQIKEKLINTIGINKRHIALTQQIDPILFFATNASSHLLKNLSIPPEQIGVLVLVTQTGDKSIPNTVIELQSNLGLDQDCLSVEINMGCSGFVQGLNISTSLLQNSEKKYALLVCGDISSKLLEEEDSGTVPLFSDALSATLISLDLHKTSVFSNANSSTNNDAIALKGALDGKYYLKLDGHKILMFALQSLVPGIKELISENKSNIDFYFFHQASKIINHTLIRKLEIPLEQCPESLNQFGNTSSATIPLTMSTMNKLKTRSNKIMICGFGTGMSWAAGIIDLEPIEFMDIIER